MRTGKILSFNVANSCGIIIDANDQDIPFFNFYTEAQLLIAKPVEFEIAITNEGLTAVKVKIVD